MNQDTARGYTTSDFNRALGVLRAHRYARTMGEAMGAFAAEHRFLAHRNGSACEDGCDRMADPVSLAALDAAERRCKRSWE